MGKAKTILSLLSLSPYIVRLLCNLFAVWLTLGWKVRKARKAFEKELMKQGMSEENAKRLGAQYKILKDNLMGGLEVRHKALNLTSKVFSEVKTN